jgi:hypothetical protein
MSAAAAGMHPLSSPLLSSLQNEVQALRRSLEDKTSESGMQLKESVDRLLSGLKDMYAKQREELSALLLNSHHQSETVAAQQSAIAAAHAEEIDALAREMKGALSVAMEKQESGDAHRFLMQKIASLLSAAALAPTAAQSPGHDASAVQPVALSRILTGHAAEMSAISKENTALKQLVNSFSVAKQAVTAVEASNQESKESTAASARVLVPGEVQSLALMFEKRRKEALDAPLQELQQVATDTILQTGQQVEAACTSVMQHMRQAHEELPFLVNSLQSIAAAWGHPVGANGDASSLSTTDALCNNTTGSQLAALLEEININIRSLLTSQHTLQEGLNNEVAVLTSNLATARETAIAAVDARLKAEENAKSEISSVTLKASKLQEGATRAQEESLHVIHKLRNALVDVEHVESRKSLQTSRCSRCDVLPRLQDRIAALQQSLQSCNDMLDLERRQGEEARRKHEAEMKDLRAEMEIEKISANETIKSLTTTIQAQEETIEGLKARLATLQDADAMVGGGNGGIASIIDEEKNILMNLAADAAAFLQDGSGMASANHINDLMRQEVSTTNASLVSIATKLDSVNLPDSLQPCIAAMTTSPLAQLIGNHSQILTNASSSIHRHEIGLQHGLSQVERIHSEALASLAGVSREMQGVLRAHQGQQQEEHEAVLAGLYAENAALGNDRDRIKTCLNDSTAKTAGDLEQVRKEVAALATTAKALSHISQERETTWERQRSEIMSDVQALDATKETAVARFKQELESTTTAWIELMVRIRDSHDKSGADLDSFVAASRAAIAKKEKAISVQLQALTAAVTSLKESTAMRNGMLNDEARLLEDMLSSSTKQVDELLSQLAKERSQHAQQLDTVREALVTVIAGTTVVESAPGPVSAPPSTSTIASPFPVPDLRMLKHLLSDENEQLRNALKNAQRVADERDARASLQLKQLRSDYERLRLAATPVITKRGQGLQVDVLDAREGPGPAHQAAIVGGGGPGRHATAATAGQGYMQPTSSSVGLVLQALHDGDVDTSFHGTRNGRNRDIETSSPTTALPMLRGPHTSPPQAPPPSIQLQGQGQGSYAYAHGHGAAGSYPSLSSRLPESKQTAPQPVFDPRSMPHVTAVIDPHISRIAEASRHAGRPQARGVTTTFVSAKTAVIPPHRRPAGPPHR